MRSFLAAALAVGVLAGAPAFAAESKNDDNDTSAMPTPVEGVDTVAPLEGANSYTQAQVEEMLTENGFTNIQGLMKDDKGIWRGTATHNGKSGAVAIDYRGNLFFEGQRIVKHDEDASHDDKEKAHD